MNLIKHALSPRWLGYLGLAVVFGIITSLFGLWQWDRRGEAVAEIERVEANYDAQPVSFEQLLPPGEQWSDDLRWRPVVVEGSYLTEHTVLVRTRPRLGAVGFEVLVPFRDQSGTVVLINRGWIPTGETRDEPDAIPVPPEGFITVEARAFAGEPTIPGRSAPSGQVATIHLPTLAEMTVPTLEQRAYLALSDESPRTSPMPLLLNRPAPDEGPHLSYTFQWFLFGILGFIAWGYLLRDDYRRNTGAEATPKRSRVKSDQEIEDELLDRANLRR